MFGTIRKHQGWLMIIIGVVVISFFLYMDPSQTGGGRSRGSADYGRIGDHQVTLRELEEAQKEFRLIYFLNTRKWPHEDRENSAQIDESREAAARVLTIVKAKEAGIHIPDQAVAEMAHRLLGGSSLEQVEKDVLVRGGLNADDFERFVRHELMRQQLAAIVGAAGQLVTPAEAEAEYRRENQEIAGEVVVFNLSNYMSRVTISNEVLTTWYSNRMAQYRTPEKMRVSYVAFPASNYLAKADEEFASLTNLNAQVEQLYERMGGTNTFRDTNGVPLPKDQAFAKIKEEQRMQHAMLSARRVANDFGSALLDAVTEKQNANQTVSAEALAEAAAKANLTVQVSEPFDMQDGPTNLNVAQEFTQKAFSLNATNNPIAFEPVPGEEAFYIIALKDTVPSRLQSFEEVKNQVADDYRRQQAFMLARQDAMEFQSKATNAVAQGKSFSEVAAQSKLQAITLPPISQRTESITNDLPVNIRQLRSLLFSLDPGEVSSFIPLPPMGGYIVHTKQKLPIDEAKLKTELPKYTAEMRFQRQNEIYSNWFRKQYEQAQATFPMLAPKNQNGGRS